MKSFPGFSGPALILLLGLSILALALPKEDIFMRVNAWNSPFMDQLFRGWTYLGEGWVVAVLVLGLLLIKIRMGLTILSAFALSGLLAQFFKRVVFGRTPRPVKFLELEAIDFDIHLVEGVRILHWYSFPSGHTATAFGVFFGLSLFLKGPWKWPALLMALGVGYSRMYLSLHFLGDVCLGMALGMGSGFLAWHWLKRLKPAWADKGLLELFKG